MKAHSKVVSVDVEDPIYIPDGAKVGDTFKFEAEARVTEIRQFGVFARSPAGEQNQISLGQDITLTLSYGCIEKKTVT
jgi:hypothetical protein